MCKTYKTERLLLRQWKDKDRQHFFAINNDPDVMRYFPRKFTREESDAFVDDNVNRIASEGWGSWAVETIDSGEFIGFVGLSRPAEWHPCAGYIEVGWRLGRSHWGQGYATEAASHALKIGFGSIGIEQVISFTSRCNVASIKVMKKLGMNDDKVGFDHPRISAISRLRKHVVYRLARTEWQANLE